MQEKIAIRNDETAGELHDELMVLGNKVMLETIRKIETGEVNTKAQEELIQGEPLKLAPKITKEFCNIDWSLSGQSIYNHIRGLSPYPAAHTQLHSENGETLELKVYASTFVPCQNMYCTGSVITDNKSFLKIAVRDGHILLTEVQQAGKKRMPIAEFLRGTQFTSIWKAEF